jgi:hypothetical protein
MKRRRSRSRRCMAAITCAWWFGAAPDSDCEPCSEDAGPQGLDRQRCEARAPGVPFRCVASPVCRSERRRPARRARPSAPCAASHRARPWPPAWRTRWGGTTARCRAGRRGHACGRRRGRQPGQRAPHRFGLCDNPRQLDQKRHVRGHALESPGTRSPIRRREARGPRVETARDGDVAMQTRRIAPGFGPLAGIGNQSSG